MMLCIISALIIVNTYMNKYLLINYIWALMSVTAYEMCIAAHMYDRDKIHACCRTAEASLPCIWGAHAWSHSCVVVSAIDLQPIQLNSANLATDSTTWNHKCTLFDDKDHESNDEWVSTVSKEIQFKESI